MQYREIKHLKEETEKVIEKIITDFESKIKLTIDEVDVSFIDVTTQSSKIKEQKPKVTIKIMI